MISPFSSIPTFSCSNKPSVPSLQFGLKIAHVEDDERMRTQVKRFLPNQIKLPSGDKLEIRQYASISELKAGIAEERPDLIVSDGNIPPEGTAEDVIRFANSQTPPIPVVIHTFERDSFLGLQDANKEEVPVFDKLNLSDLGQWISKFAQNLKN